MIESTSLWYITLFGSLNYITKPVSANIATAFGLPMLTALWVFPNLVKIWHISVFCRFIPLKYDMVLTCYRSPRPWWGKASHLTRKSSRTTFFPGASCSKASRYRSLPLIRTRPGFLNFRSSAYYGSLLGYGVCLIFYMVAASLVMGLHVA